MHDRNPLFVKLSNGDIRNGYELHILNKTHEDRTYALEVHGIESKKMVLKNTHEINMHNILVFADSVGHFRFFLSSNKQNQSRIPITFTLTDMQTGTTDHVESVFVNAR